MAVVGLERTLYEVEEDVGVVEVCALVYSPRIDCPIAIPFSVRLSTSDNTAGMHIIMISIDVMNISFQSNNITLQLIPWTTWN